MNTADALLFLRVVVCRALVGILLTLPPAYAGDSKKVLHVDSYHPGFAWSQGVAEGMDSRLLMENVWFKRVYLNAWRNPSAAAVAAEADRIRQSIQTLKPDVVITSDDAAAKLAAESLVRESSTEFIFSGVDWNAGVYSFPNDRVTGIIEVPLVRSLVDQLSKYAAGTRLGFLSLNTLSARRDLEHYPAQLGRPLDQAYLVEDFEQWKQRFVELQGSVDMLILNAVEDAIGWDFDAMRDFVQRETRIPAGTTFASAAPASLICVARIPQEQGWWAADAALKVMSGTPASEIPVSRNKEGKLIINLDLAHRLNLTISQEILEIADILQQPPQ